MARNLIVSLLPGATEMIVALGARDQLVGISHECDWPPEIQSLPRVTATPIDPARSSGEIDRAVREAVAAGRAVIGIDADALRRLAPDLIVTQVLCDVCAVADGEAIRLAEAMTPAPQVIALEGKTLRGVWDDIRNLGAAIGRLDDGEALTKRLEREVAEITAHTNGAARPRVVAIEWLDPLFVAGHWVPEMIAAAGGVDVGAVPGSHSVVHEWDAIMRLEPDLVFVILCGFDERRAWAELAAITDSTARDWLASRRVVVLDGNAYTSRPGPRLVDGMRLMAAAIGD
jgi:iron complex transport system substrate-binding protein